VSDARLSSRSSASLPVSLGRFKQYPRTKPSGIDWVGSVPEHWRLASLRWNAKLYAGGTPDRAQDVYWDEGTIPWINSGAVNQILIKEPSAFITHDGYSNSSARWVPKGALVMALAGQGKTKGMVAQVDIDTTCNQSMAAIVPGEKLAPRFLFWWLTAQYITVRNLSGGEQRDGLNLEIIGSLAVPLLPLDEQRRIACFLDTQTAKIDTLVSKKRELIERLKEKRQALISQTVTRGLPPDAARAAGLDPYPKLNPSGIEWLGDVPRHWVVKRLRFLGDAIIGLTFDPGDIVDEGRGTLVLRASNVVAGRIVLEDTLFVRGPIPDRLITRAGDILICSRSGSRALIGKNAMIDERSAGLTFGTFMTVFRSSHNEFLSYVFNSQLFEFQSGAFLTSTINQLTVSNLYSFEVPVPPPSEQRLITAFLRREVARIDELSATIEEAVERALEYRSALTTAAVTGKIDVRGLAK